MCKTYNCSKLRLEFSLYDKGASIAKAQSFQGIKIFFLNFIIKIIFIIRLIKLARNNF